MEPFNRGERLSMKMKTMLTRKEASITANASRNYKSLAWSGLLFAPGNSSKAPGKWE
jgi:hypothetical protein